MLGKSSHPAGSRRFLLLLAAGYWAAVSSAPAVGAEAFPLKSNLTVNVLSVEQQPSSFVQYSYGSRERLNFLAKVRVEKVWQTNQDLTPDSIVEIRYQYEVEPPTKSTKPAPAINPLIRVPNRDKPTLTAGQTTTLWVSGGGAYAPSKNGPLVWISNWCTHRAGDAPDAKNSC